MFEKIEDDGVVKCIVFQIADSDNPDYYAIGMLKEQDIKCIISPSVTVHNGETYIRYDVSDLITLREFLYSRLNKKQLLCVFSEIIGIIQELESYLLDISLLFTDLDHIFVKKNNDNADCKIAMIYLPYQKEHVSVHDMFKEILFNTGFREERDGSYIAVILNALGKTGNFRINEFDSVIKKLCEERSRIVIKKYTAQEVAEAEVAEMTEVYDIGKKKKENKSFIGFIRNVLFGYQNNKAEEETYYEIKEDKDIITHVNSETTVMLADEVSQENCPYMIRCSTGEKIIINKPVFRIGKDNRYADYIIGDNAAVSRAHAEITISGQEVYLRDEDSLNHTYINGNVADSNEKTLIKDQDVIIFADEEYIFYR